MTTTTNAVAEVKQVYAAPDGTQFATKREAQDYMRRPLIRAELLKLTENNEELSDWIVESKEELDNAFSTGQIRRVSKSDRTKMEKALDYIEKNHDDVPALRFLIENKEDIAEGFKWPSVKRMDEEEKEAAIKAELTALADDNEEVADFIIENQEAIFEAFNAGKPKRTINPAAREGLQKWREEQKALKEAEEGKPAKKAKK